MKLHLGWVSAIVEIFGLCAISAGLGIEVMMHADLGYIFITAGSLVTAAGGLLFAKVYHSITRRPGG